MTNAILYDRQHPFLASIKERYPLSKPESDRNTQHLVLDLRDSGLSYQVGDSVGILPAHDPKLVQKTLDALQSSGNELVLSKNISAPISFRELLTSHCNITTISPKLLQEVINRQIDSDKTRHLHEMQKDRDHLKKYLGSYEIWDFLLAHSEVRFSAGELTSLLMPLLPRFYSIASSQNHVGDELHLIVAPLTYETNGHQRHGVCTHYLCELTAISEPAVPMFIQSAHDFYLPEDPSISLLMIGPGTGVAPFRAFIQERVEHQKAKGHHWLFFGERTRQYDFFYEEEWMTYQSEGSLRLDLAFSRDQEHKVYVQHKMWENGFEIYEWLENGSYIYVCGDAHRMAKDVEAILQMIVQEYGQKTPHEAREYIKKLRQQKRYLRDVY
jgi:sulfite reductase (NADPH) flavoprotein alpha-component